MKNSIKSLVAIAAFGAFALGAFAQPAVKVLVVDMAKLYDTHYKTVEQNAKIQADDQKAQEEVEKMNKDGNALVEEYKSLNDQSNNPALSADAKAKAQGAAQAKLEAIQNKQREVQTFIQNTRNSLGQRLNTFRSLMLEEISKVAADVAKRKGGNLLLDKAGPTAIGISNIVYADAAFDITDDVMKEVNKDRPAGAATAAPAAAPASPSGAPAVSVPGLGGAKK
ncbi:OmpH family outer membrane protein [Horticoccus sp. 23ND18S-11]|uniref:OmpH family outer membrane protein n=1 Tax=Horticoccus sp. 23ND18S-11 TaxID=3391832 RepID=UPI0039C8D30E